MQDHFIKNVNDLSLRMTPAPELPLMWGGGSLRRCHRQLGDEVLSAVIILIRLQRLVLLLVSS